MHNDRRRRGLGRADALASLAAGLLLAALLVPTLSATQRMGRRSVSADNLRAMHAMHECYVADWSDRQYTAVPDDLATYGNDIISACQSFNVANGQSLPAMLLGWGCLDDACSDGCQQGLWGFYQSACGANTAVVVPLDFDAVFGAFRIPNSWPLHDYLSGGTAHGRYFDERYSRRRTRRRPSSPSHSSTSRASTCRAPSSESRCGRATRCPRRPCSIRAVLRPTSEDGFQDPFSFADGFRSPAAGQVAYADLKTRMIEHNWLDAPPAPCNPGFEGCVPYQFNHGADATPLTLFFDGSVSGLRTGDVVQQDDRAPQAQRDRSTATGSGAATPRGASAAISGNTRRTARSSSHHVLTTGGIRGRDRIR